jgi:hypothetical protein
MQTVKGSSFSAFTRGFRGAFTFCSGTILFSGTASVNLNKRFGLYKKIKTKKIEKKDKQRES